MFYQVKRNHETPAYLYTKMLNVIHGHEEIRAYLKERSFTPRVNPDIVIHQKNFLVRVRMAIYGQALDGSFLN